jgi:cysteine desulfurase
MRGGGQESRLRAGTENLSGIAGFGAAARAVIEHGAAERERITQLRDALEAGITRITPDAVIIGAGAPRLGNTICVGLPGLKAETAVIAFDLAGVSIGAGSACSSGKVAQSHVLVAMNVVPELSASCVRISLGWSSTQEDVTRFLGVWERLGASQSRRRPVQAA